MWFIHPLVDGDSALHYGKEIKAGTLYTCFLLKQRYIAVRPQNEPCDVEDGNPAADRAPGCGVLGRQAELSSLSQ